MLPAPPRTVASTGSAGSGASVLWRSAVLKEGVPHVCVDVRATEDTLRRVARALSVGSVEVCGDLLDFVEEACRMARATCGGGDAAGRAAAARGQQHAAGAQGRGRAGVRPPCVPCRGGGAH
nr:unnamed protein product [Leishmania braziliensis]